MKKSAASSPKPSRATRVRVTHRLEPLETPSGMLNSIGLTNPGLEGFIAEKLPQLAELPTARIVSIAGTSSEEFAEMAKTLCDRGGFDAIELNISSPNMKDGGMLFGCREDAARDVTRAVKDVSHLPVIVKLTPNVTDIVGIASSVEAGGADGIALINTLLGMAIDAERRAPSSGTSREGYRVPLSSLSDLLSPGKSPQRSTSLSSAWAASPTRPMRSNS